MKKIEFVILFLVWNLTGVLAQVNLSFNPPKGNKYEYQTEVVQNIRQTVMGQEIPVEMLISTKYLMEIADKTPQETTARFTYMETAYIMSSPMMKMGYDSKNPAENPSEFDSMLSKMFENLSGKSFVAVIAPDGSVKSLSGMDAIAESMMEAIAGDGAMYAQLGAQMKQQFSDSAVKNSFEQAFKIYPPSAVTAGNSWNIDNSQVLNGMNVASKTKYTLKGVSKNVATVAVESKIDMIASEIMEGKLTGAQTGTLTMDTKTGLTLTGETSQSIKGNVTAQGMDVAMELVTKTKTSTREVK